MREKEENKREVSNVSPTHMFIYRDIVELKNYVQLHGHLLNKICFHNYLV